MNLSIEVIFNCTGLYYFSYCFKPVYLNQISKVEFFLDVYFWERDHVHMHREGVERERGS